MKPPIFDYVAAESHEHALDVLREHGDDAKVLAGGQSLVPLMSFRLAKPAVLLDINGLDGLDTIEMEDGRMSIGALTRQCELLTHPLIAERCPLMRAATEFIGHPAIRNRGTVGGSVAHADPAAELPILLQVLDAEIEVRSAGSRRTVPAEDFFMGLLMTGMEPDELLTGISFALPEKGVGWGFHEVARRHGDFALVAVAALVTLDDRGAVAEAAVALGGIADRPLRVASVEEALKGNRPTPDTIEAASHLVDDAVTPVGDIHAGEGYRAHLGQVLTRRAICDAVERARGT